MCIVVILDTAEDYDNSGRATYDFGQIGPEAKPSTPAGNLMGVSRQPPSGLIDPHARARAFVATDQKRPYHRLKFSFLALEDHLRKRLLCRVRDAQRDPLHAQG